MLSINVKKARKNNNTVTIDRMSEERLDIATLELFPDLAGLSSSSTMRRTRNISGSVGSDISSIVDEDILFGEDTELIPYLTGGNHKDDVDSESDVVEVVTSHSIGNDKVGTSNQITIKMGKSACEMINNGQNASRCDIHRNDNTVLNVSYPTSKSNSNTGPRTMTKSAIAARENRERKKIYTTSLELRVKELDSENQSLKAKVNSMAKSLSSLDDEVQYLRAVLANQSSIAALLKNIPNCKTDGLELTSMKSNNTEPLNALQYKRKGSSDNASDHSYKVKKVEHAYATPEEEIVKTHSSNGNVSSLVDTTSAGVCLHVSDKKVSLEFCAQCNRKAFSIS